MTLRTLYNRVPWADLKIDVAGQIRHVGEPNFCPIDTAGGDWHKPGGKLGLSKKDANLIITAADTTIEDILDSIASCKEQLRVGVGLKKMDRKYFLDQIALDRRVLQVRKSFERRIAAAQG